MTATSAVPSPQSFLAFDFGTRRVGALVHEWQPAALVIGVPFHPDGAAHENTQRARRFGRQLHGRFRLPVNEVDERYTTTEARSEGAVDVDAASAALILDQFLRELR
jgi:putative holliday junction resolvase